jgi:hypothetical protein
VIEGSLTPGHPAGFDPITATAEHGGGVTLDVYIWDPAINGGLGGYVFQFETSNPQVVRPNT